MAFMRTWSISTPADTDLSNILGSAIRNLREDIEERMEIDHEWTDATDGGKHKHITFLDPITTPIDVVDEGMLYTKNVNDKAELHWKDEDGNELQLTDAGVITTVIDAEGDLVLGDSNGLASQLVIGAADTFLKSDGTTAAWAIPEADEVVYDPITSGLTAVLVQDAIDEVVVDSGNFMLKNGDAIVTFSSLGPKSGNSSHNLGNTPSVCSWYIEKTSGSSESGWATGDRMWGESWQPRLNTEDSAGLNGITVGADANKIYYAHDDNMRAFAQGGSGLFSPNENNWKLVVRVWL